MPRLGNFGCPQGATHECPTPVFLVYSMHDRTVAIEQGRCPGSIWSVVPTTMVVRRMRFKEYDLVKLEAEATRGGDACAVIHSGATRGAEYVPTDLIAVKR